MTRPRSQTIGPLGRAPARSTKDPLTRPPQRLPPLPPAPNPQPKEGAVRAWLRDALFENVGLKFLSMVLAITVFLLVNDDKDREITVRVGVGYVLPADKVLVSDRYDEVRVTLRGPWRRLRQLDERELDRISVDLRDTPSGELAFTPDMVRAPSGLRVASISPRTMRLAFEKRRERIVEVSPVVTGQPEHGYRVVEVKTTPGTASVRGPEKLVSALAAVRTREIALDGHSETFTVQAQLEPPDSVEPTTGDFVTVEVKLDQELVARKMPDVPVLLSGDGIDPAKWKVTPKAVELTLTGPLLAVEAARSSLVLTVKVTGGGGRDLLIVADGVPPGLGVRISPERVRVAPAGR